MTEEWKATGGFLQTTRGREEKRQSLEIWVGMNSTESRSWSWYTGYFLMRTVIINIIVRVWHQGHKRGQMAKTTDHAGIPAECSVSPTSWPWERHLDGHSESRAFLNGNRSRGCCGSTQMTKSQWSVVSTQSASHALCSGPLAFVLSCFTVDLKRQKDSSPQASYNLHQLLISFRVAFLCVGQTPKQNKDKQNYFFQCTVSKASVLGDWNLCSWAHSWAEQYSDGAVRRMSWQTGSK